MYLLRSTTNENPSKDSELRSTTQSEPSSKQTKKLRKWLLTFSQDGYSLSSNCVLHGINLIKFIASNKNNLGSNGSRLFYHFILTSSQDYATIIDSVNIDDLYVKTIVVFLKEDPLNEHKILIRIEHKMKTTVIEMPKNDLYRLSQLVKFPESGPKVVIFNLESSQEINNIHWDILTDFVSDSSESFNSTDCIETLVYSKGTIHSYGRTLKTHKQPPSSIDQFGNQNAVE